jgi:hypothetical protein
MSAGFIEERDQLGIGSDPDGIRRQARSSIRNGNRNKTGPVAGSNGHKPAARLPAPQMKQIGVNIVPARHLGHSRPGRQALLDHPQLLGRAPAPPPLGTRQNRSLRHVCPLICKFAGKHDLIPAAISAGGFHPTDTAFASGKVN